MAIIPAKDVGRVILEDLREFAKKELPDATEAEREQAIAQFLGAWGTSMALNPMPK